MRRNNMHKVFAGLLAMIVIVCAVIIGWAAAEPEQTKDPAEPEPLVINTVESGDDMLLTVIREDETVFQYAGDIDLWSTPGTLICGKQRTGKPTALYIWTRRCCSEGTQRQEGNESRSAETLRRTGRTGRTARQQEGKGALPAPCLPGKRHDPGTGQADGVTAMTVRDLIDRLIAGIQSGELRGSDPVPADILEEDNKSVFEYIAEKYGIGEDDKSGHDQRNTDELSEQESRDPGTDSDY